MSDGEEPPPSAGIVSRGAAFAVDGLLVTASVLGGALFAWGVAQVIGLRDLFGAGDEGTGRQLAVLVLVPLIFSVYCAVMWALLGKTVGMALMGVKVVRMDGTSVRLGQSLLRVACYPLSAILLIGFAWMAVDRRRQALHDKVARTLVVYDRPYGDVRSGSASDPPLSTAFG